MQRALVRAGLPGKVVYVLELQKRGAIHWHLCFQGRQPRKHWAVEPLEFRSMLDDVLRNHGFTYKTIKSASRVERIKKSLVGYMSKYMTKGEPEQGTTLGFPTAWWGMSRELLTEIKQKMVTGTIEVAENFSWFDALDAFVRVQRLIFADVFITNTGIPVCLYGRAAPSSIGLVFNIFDNLHQYI